MSKLDQEIRKKIFHPVYLLYGNEDYLRRYYRNLLKNALVDETDTINLHIWQGQQLNVDELIGQAMTLPFFSEHRVIIVKDSGLFKKGGQVLAEAFPSFSEQTVIIFDESETDARSKLYKLVREKGFIQEFRHPTSEQMATWIVNTLGRYKKQIQRSALALFQERVGTDMELGANEIKKLAGYVGERDKIYLEDVRAVTIILPETKVFQMIDAMAVKKTGEALKIYHDLMSAKESAVAVLTLIGRQFALILEVASLRERGFDTENIIRITGQQDFKVRKALRQASYFPKNQAERVMRMCAAADHDIKKGRMSDQLAAELVIAATV